MANYQVFDANGSIITIQSSTFGSVERQIVGASIIGALAATLTGTPSVSGTLGSSIIGTVPVTQSGLTVTSIIGNFAEDSPHASGDFGVLNLAVRNGTMASITSADGDYSPIVTGAVGEVITANAPLS